MYLSRYPLDSKLSDLEKLNALEHDLTFDSSWYTLPVHTM